ncbi:hypothetical protein C1646_774551 [Rhizophagus diaphanus]|nr:hypothetical protein C1646_774551 [Rhizophagus diaphanus] [Rhizophagus sp. MUCL 43196]
MRYLLSRDLSDFEPQEISKYLEWCGENGEKPFSNNITGKKFSDIAKFRESGLDDMEEFSDISQADLPENEIADIPIFNVPETVLEKPTIPQKIIPPQPEENLPPRDKKADKQDESTQLLFDYVAEDTCVLVTSTSGTSETSKTPEPVIDKPEVGKFLESIKPINKIMNMPPKEADPLKPNEVSSAILLSRAQREERLRKKAVELGEDPDAEELEEDPKEYMDMKVRERLIGEEIIHRSLENDGVTSSWLDTDEK